MTMTFGVCMNDDEEQRKEYTDVENSATHISTKKKGSGSVVCGIQDVIWFNLIVPK